MKPQSQVAAWAEPLIVIALGFLAGGAVAAVAVRSLGITPATMIQTVLAATALAYLATTARSFRARLRPRNSTRTDQN